MGLARKLRKKFETPQHPWQRSRLEYEGKIKDNYGIRRKNEIWKINSLLKKFKRQAKKLIAMTSGQAEIEKKQLIARLNSLGLIEKDATMDHVLTLTLQNLMDRRLQSKVVALGLAKTPKQARQMVVHGHISVNENIIDSPSYLMKAGDKIRYTTSSKFNDPNNPEREKMNKEKVKLDVLKEKKVKKEAKENKKGDKKENVKDVKDEKKSE